MQPFGPIEIANRKQHIIVHVYVASVYYIMWLVEVGIFNEATEHVPGAMRVQ